MPTPWSVGCQKIEGEQPVSSFFFFFLIFLSFLFLSFYLLFSCSSFLSLLLISTELNFFFGSWWRISSQTTLTCVTHANLSTTILPCMRLACHLASLMCQVSFPLVPNGTTPSCQVSLYDLSIRLEIHEILIVSEFNEIRLCT